MRYEVRLTAFDLFDQVHVAWVMESTVAHTHQRETIALGTNTVMGVGELDERTWLRDVLVATIETL